MNDEEVARLILPIPKSVYALFKLIQTIGSVEILSDKSLFVITYLLYVEFVVMLVRFNKWHIQFFSREIFIVILFVYIYILFDTYSDIY